MMLNKLTPQQIDIIIKQMKYITKLKRKSLSVFCPTEEYKNNYFKEIQDIVDIVDILEGNNVKNN